MQQSELLFYLKANNPNRAVAGTCTTRPLYEDLYMHDPSEDTARPKYYATRQINNKSFSDKLQYCIICSNSVLLFSFLQSRFQSEVAKINSEQPEVKDNDWMKRHYSHLFSLMKSVNKIIIQSSTVYYGKYAHFQNDTRNISMSVKFGFFYYCIISHELGRWLYY